MADQICIGIVAGEKSGDILGAGLIRALKQRYPTARFVGIGGPDMEAEGCESLAPMERLSVMGFVEPLGRLPELFSIKRKLAEFYIKNRPLVVIGIDSPAFNLRLELTLKENNIPTVHYVSPSVWAYHKSRIHKIKRAVDLMLTLFPFETAIYDEYAVAARCIGHPLADQIDFDELREQNRQTLNLASNMRLVALLPGSRVSEIDRLAPAFFGAAMESLSSFPDLKFLVPCSGKEARACVTEHLNRIGALGTEQFVLLDDSRSAMSAADLVVMASGTATLEAMLLRRPMVVCYKLAPLTYAIASRIVKVDHIALPNLLAGERLVPEYIQENVTVAALRDEISSHFADSTGREPMLQEFARLHKALRRDASNSAADAIVELLERKSARVQ